MAWFPTRTVHDPLRMGSEEARDDVLARWLDGPGRSLLDALLSEAHDLIGVVDRELKIRYVNFTSPSYTREQVVGLSVLDLVPPTSREVAERTYREVLETGKASRFDSTQQVPGGAELWEIRVGPIRAEGQVIGLIGITSDVTEQRREQAARDRFFALSMDMLAVAGTDGKFRHINQEFAKALGYDPKEMLGEHFLDFIHPEDCEASAIVFNRLLQGETINDFEARFVARNGRHRMYSWRATVDPVSGDIYAVARDVTQHHAIEQQLRHSQKMEAVGQLAGGVAHDFNNLMLAVLANAELAKDEAPSVELREYLEEIHAAGRRAAALTKQLLAFSRSQPLRKQSLNLNQLISGLMKMLHRLLPEDITVDFIEGHQLCSVQADPTQLEQVIVNLCVNARDAMPSGGRLTLETENVLINGRYRESHPWARPGRYVLLSVTDTGEGMSADQREHAFEPFYTTKPLHEGTGLGLSTVYGIVRSHDGMVQLYSELDQGTTAKVYLPAGERLAVDVGDKLEVQPKTGTETILVAEDEELVRRAVTRILRKAGYTVLEAVDGFDAIRRLREASEPVSLVLLDVVMPNLSGPAAWLRLQELQPGLRVLFSSGYADNRYQEQLPPDAEILEKPFRVEALLRSIRRKLDG